jgi:uncharacterized protein
MYIERNIDPELKQWKESTSRKPLILRGARQVGKSSSVRNLAKSFDYYIEVNFDDRPEIKTIFENYTQPNDICEQLSIFFNTSIIEGKTLVFFDEIQTCIPAISSLRYFYEKMPNLHIISAGSLLEFVLAEIPSFGVGRVRSMFLYPLNFTEFLKGVKEELLLKALQKASSQEPLAEILHQKLNNYYKKFLIIGGMPEAVSHYIEHQDLLEIQRILNDLIISLRADFVKYKHRIDTSRISEVFNSVVNQMGGKYTYSYPHASLNNKQIKEILELLTMAGLIIPVTHSSSNGIPLGAEINPKKQKYLILDTGIFQRILGVNISNLMLENDINFINKGGIAELFVGLELLKSNSCYEQNELYYWQRESKSSQAEVDFVIQKDRLIIPIEVKSGTKGSMQSLYLFLTEKKKDFGIRLSLENFGSIEHVKIMPIYAIGTYNVTKN